MDYSSTPQWRERRSSYLAKHEAKCFVCSLPCDQLHHITYDRIGNERDTDLIWLCRPHHYQVHNDPHLTKLPLELRHIRLKFTLQIVNSEDCETFHNGGS